MGKIIRQAVLGAIGTGVNALTQNARESRSNRNAREMMTLQTTNQKQLNQQGYELQKKMWEETNYPAQVKMLKEAGLNAGLMYGMSGGGGTTTGSQTEGSATNGQVAQTQQMGLENLALASQIEL